MSINYGFNKNKYPLLKPQKCPDCNKNFRTRNPRKKFCSEKCRVKNWIKNNGQSREIRRLRKIIIAARQIEEKF
jgi:hypothetical protein